MAQRTELNSDTRFWLVILSGMMLYLCLATAGFAILGVSRILPDMTEHVHWLVGTAVASGVVSMVSLVLSRSKATQPAVRTFKA